jgi:hypothetical protein
MTVAASYRPSISPDGPTATISPLRTATEPRSMFGPAIVTTVPPVMRRSIFSAARAGRVRVRARRSGRRRSMAGTIIERDVEPCTRPCYL